AKCGSRVHTTCSPWLSRSQITFSPPFSGVPTTDWSATVPTHPRAGESMYRQFTFELFPMPINLLVARSLAASTSPPPLPAVAVLDITDTIILRLRYPPLLSSTSPAPSLSVSAACRHRRCLAPPPWPFLPPPVSVNFPHSGSLSSPATDWVTSIDQHRNQATSSRRPPASRHWHGFVAGSTRIPCIR
ncbi:hypothetical protein B0H14DRAFT_3559002, partial [Mycena olivaceomarginata]